MDNGALKDWLNERFREQREMFMELRRVDEQQREVLRKNMERRLEGMNEFREDLRRQATTFQTREACEVQMEVVGKFVDELRQWRSNIEGRFYMIAAVPIVVSVVLGGIAIWTALARGG